MDAFLDRILNKILARLLFTTLLIGFPIAIASAWIGAAWMNAVLGFDFLRVLVVISTCAMLSNLPFLFLIADS